MNTELEIIKKDVINVTPFVPDHCPELHNAYRGFSVPSELMANKAVPMSTVPILLGLVGTLSSGEALFTLAGLTVSALVFSFLNVFSSKASLKAVPEAIDDTCNYRYLDSSSWSRCFAEGEYVIKKKHFFKYENKEDPQHFWTP